MWLQWVEIAAAVYLVGMALIINADSNWQSKLLFKAIPMFIGLPLAFGAIARLNGWPL